jgi:hypothetical protein
MANLMNRYGGVSLVGRADIPTPKVSNGSFILGSLNGVTLNRILPFSQPAGQAVNPPEVNAAHNSMAHGSPFPTVKLLHARTMKMRLHGRSALRAMRVMGN